MYISNLIYCLGFIPIRPFCRLLSIKRREFIKENKQTQKNQESDQEKKKEIKNSTKKATKKKRKNFLFFLVSFFLVFFNKFPPQVERRKGREIERD